MKRSVCLLLMVGLLWALSDCAVPSAPPVRPPLALGEDTKPLRCELQRQFENLAALGWLGRVYLAVPWLDQLLPLFRLEPYAGDFVLEDGCVCTLKESSVLPRGIPLTFRLTVDRGDVTGAALLGIGCDLFADSEAGPTPSWSQADWQAPRALPARLGRAKRVLVEAVVHEIFGRLARVAKAAEEGAELAACAEAAEFFPRQDLFAREGTAEKWLQCVSGYYFAEAVLQDVHVPSVDPEAAVRFTFYLDPTEPLNSEDPMMSMNPEVIRCTFTDVKS
ncbi:unnamed protein product [Effrenium voratum]|uniref:Lipoprotein n=1 Tax=Effrenium voratum TaxID=2562239 RepID=A0AA36I5N9_9DINO|nr:unnamed protein product [Effrenium voratum]